MKKSEAFLLMMFYAIAISYAMAPKLADKVMEKGTLLLKLFGR